MGCIMFTLVYCESIKSNRISKTTYCKSKNNSFIIGCAVNTSI